MTVAIYVLVLLVSSGLTWVGSSRLERVSERLAIRYRLPLLVRGTLVVAVSSSFPELVTTVTSSLVHGEFELGMSTIVGSAIFNILVIPGLSGLVHPDLGYDLRLVYRDAQFYLTSVAVLLLAFSFALIYEPVQGAELTGTMTRWIALIPLALYGLYLFLQHQETSGQGSVQDADEQEVARIRETSAARDWLWLALALAMIVAGIEGLLRTALWLGEVLDTPSFLWGASVIAAVTSLPDAIISMRGARKGEGDVSLGNVLGSNIFDLLVAVPAGVLIAGASPVDFGVAAPLVGYLTLSTVVLFTAMRTRLSLSRFECWLLLALYVGFLAWLALETAGVTSLM